jgi:hypothetical protein
VKPAGRRRYSGTAVAVMIGERVVMRDHKLLTVDEQAAIAKAREYQKAIAASLGMQ